jgi:membrane protein DedA with SNARE-associated domain
VPAAFFMIGARMFSTHTIHQFLSEYGYAAVFVFVMVESLGIPFPGETVLIAAALFAGATHHLQIELIWAVAAAAAIIGDNIGYAVGFYGGYPLLLRYGSRIKLDEAKLKVGRLVFARHGGKVVFFGRFVSVLRTYAAFLAGVNHMHWARFFAFNAAGGIVWSAIYSFGFYYAGSALSKARGSVDIAIGVAAAGLIVGFLLWARGHVRRLEQEAEKAYPGPLAKQLGATG